MFKFLKKKSDKLSDNSNNTTVLELKIDGMHCSSCSISIDGELEDLDGVISAKTSYAKQTTKVEYDKSKTDEAEIEKTIDGLGYKIIT